MIFLKIEYQHLAYIKVLIVSVDVFELSPSSNGSLNFSLLILVRLRYF